MTHRVLVVEDEQDLARLLVRLLEGEGYAVEACYGWFDRRPYFGGEYTIWVARATA